MLEIYDADVLSSDDLLGIIKLDLSAMIPGASTARECKLSMLTRDKNKEPVNLFKKKNYRAWWPVALYEAGVPKKLTVIYLIAQKEKKLNFETEKSHFFKKIYKRVKSMLISY
jgi:hypothetical protein